MSGRPRSGGGRGAQDVHPVRTVLHWTVRGALFLLLINVCRLQVNQYNDQPVFSSPVRRPAPFPRLTVCSGGQLNDYRLLRENMLGLENGTLTLAEYYNRTTLEILRSELKVGGAVLEAPTAWKQRFYLVRTKVPRFRMAPMRCHTFHPDAAEPELGKLSQRDVNDHLTVELTLVTSPHFISLPDDDDVAYRLFVHGAEEPNVDDLKRKEYIQVPATPKVEMKPGYRVKLRVSSHINERVNVRRQPCGDQSGYSLSHCLKACRWDVQAATMLCRMPHMVSQGVYLPDLRGPVDFWPACTKLIQTHGFADGRPFCRQFFNDPRSLLGDTCAAEVSTHTRPAVVPADAPDGEDGECPLPDVWYPMAEHTIDNGQLSCEHCLPACFNVTYHLNQTLMVRQGSSCTSSVKLELEMTAEAIQESRTFTMTTLLANIGGFIGLISGFSLLTLAELSEALLDVIPQRWQLRRRVKVNGQQANDGHSSHHSSAAIAFQFKADQNTIGAVETD